MKLAKGDRLPAAILILLIIIGILIPPGILVASIYIFGWGAHWPVFWTLFIGIFIFTLCTTIRTGRIEKRMIKRLKCRKEEK
jgi:hypothetical protein|tara:strand:+ start:416 stop:661 length:246 start_codon:yes stop_codon:yes gene_type:complete